MQSAGVDKRISPSDAVFVDERLKRTIFVSVCAQGFRLECVDDGERGGKKRDKGKAAHSPRKLKINGSEPAHLALEPADVPPSVLQSVYCTARAAASTC